MNQNLRLFFYQLFRDVSPNSLPDLRHWA